MTFDELEYKIPEWIQYVGNLKKIHFGIGYVGWDWSVRTIKRKLQLSFNFYFPDGKKARVIILVPNEFFKKEEMKNLDKEAGIIGHNFSEENIIRLRFMYTIWYLYYCIARTNEQTAIDNLLGMDVKPNGYLDFRQF